MRSYHVDLALPEEDRWEEVIVKERKSARRLMRAVKKQLSVAPGWLLALLRRVYGWSGGLYQREIHAWAEGLDESATVVTAAQCSYELSMLEEYAGKAFGCTTAVVRHPEEGMLLVRYLDWDLPEMSDATLRFTFHRGAHEFTTIGLPGFVGALTGWVPGKYAAAINQAPASRLPSVAMGSAFLLRDVFENCRLYRSAVYALSRTPISSPTFFTVCGAEDGQGCVVERLRDKYAIRSLRRRDALVQTNHHVVNDWCDTLNPDDDGQQDSEERKAVAEAKLAKPRKTASGVLSQLEESPVLSDTTVQRMVIRPSDGKHVVRT